MLYLLWRAQHDAERRLIGKKVGGALCAVASLVVRIPKVKRDGGQEGGKEAQESIT